MSQVRSAGGSVPWAVGQWPQRALQKPAIARGE